MRPRRDLWMVSCSCDWSEETVSRFSALMALRRHLEMQSRPDLQDHGQLGSGLTLVCPQCLDESIEGDPSLSNRVSCNYGQSDFTRTVRRCRLP